MIEPLARAAVWLAMQAATADTMNVRQVAANPSTFEKVTSVASGLLTLTMLALAVALIPAAWNFRKSFQKVNHLLERVYGDVTPLMRHASSIADNVEYITTSIRADVQHINATITTANRRLQSAVAQTEGRLREFNALLQVVQDEAEQAFVSAASTVRGVRTGAAALREDGGPEFAMVDEHERLDDELLDDEELDDEELDVAEAMDDVGQPELEEDLDGYDGDAEPPARPVARPRVRPRGGERRRG